MPPARETEIISANEIEFGWEHSTRPILSIASFRVAAGERLFIQGPSGSGKSTLLSLLGGVILPQRGDIRVLDRSLALLSRAERDAFRGDHVGFVFQMFNLVPYLSALENVTLPCLFSRRRMEKATAASSLACEALRLLDHLGLDGEIAGRSATELSVGQQQRVAAARALLGRPEILVADEPTSALDTDMRGAFVDLLMRECDANDTTLLFVSHDGSLARHFDRVVALDAINRAL